MAKRKLNKQQQSRIAHNQFIKQQNDETLLKGLVVTHYGSEIEVMACNEDGQYKLDSRQRCHVRANLPPVVCGDNVLWRMPTETSDTGIVETVLDRRSVIERPRPYQDPKPVAANIDTIVLVFSAHPAPIASLLDRYLIAAEAANIDIVLLLNKTDLLDTLKDQQLLDEINELIALYDGLGYPIYCGSANSDSIYAPTDKQTPLPLSALFANKTSILVGQSGVGKSSIINQLVQDDVAAVSYVSKSNDKGRHTTTTAELYFIDHCTANDFVTADPQEKEKSTLATEQTMSAVIDSPGIREFGLWHLGLPKVIDGMREFREFAQQCKFRDCEHGVSKGCALQVAFENGSIHPSRIASYRQILASIEDS